MLPSIRWPGWPHQIPEHCAVQSQDSGVWVCQPVIQVMPELAQGPGQMPILRLVLGGAVPRERLPVGTLVITVGPDMYVQPVT